MTIIQAAILGAIEGITEYLPISSTGHLLVAQRAMGIGGDAASSDSANAYAICIQFGAILAVVGLYSRRLWQMVQGMVGRNPEGLKLGINLVVAFLPAAVVGLTTEHLIKHYLFGGQTWGLWPIVSALFVGGIAILVIDRYLIAPRRHQNQGALLAALSWKGALLIGAVQCLALWPGTSRSLATILGGLFAGLTLGAAIEFSFLLGLVTLTASTLLDAVQNGPAMISQYGWLAPAAGMLVAAVSAAAAVKWMVRYLGKHSMAVFGYYRIVFAGSVAVVLLWFG